MTATTPSEDLLHPRLTDVVVTRRALAGVLGDGSDPDVVLALGLTAGARPVAGPVGEGEAAGGAGRGAAPGGAAPGPELAGLVTRLDALGLDGADLVATHEPSAAAEALTAIPLSPGAHPVRRLFVAGLGDAATDRIRTAGAVLARAARGRGHVIVDGGDWAVGEALAAFVEGFLLGGWAPPRWTGDGVRAGTTVPGRLTIACPPDAAGDPQGAAGDPEGAAGDPEGIVADACVRVRAVVRARSLGVTPSNVKNPAWVTARARTLGRRTGLTVTVRSQRDLRREGFGGLLAVGGGSATPPRLVQLDWEPPGATDATPRAVLVGKGITFDTGGLQVKSRENMLPMKTDMLGSAIVLAVLSVCRELRIGVRVTGLLALAENAFGGGSYRPGDVVTQYGGTRVEIGNTDAEGRIVLADALAYADAALDPDWLVDIATLTGAARVAFARIMAPVYATDASLRSELVAAGETTGETLWPMPLPDGYRRALDSDVADLVHIAPKVGGGSITAALFLREFTGERRWAHLDIAGPGRSDVDAGILGKGATAFGTRLLLRWLEGLA